jgi:hypothetical protein
MIRPSNPALLAVTQTLTGQRDRLVARWSAWIATRMSHAPHIKRPTIERHLALLVDLLIELSGPLRRKAAELWYQACEAYGQTAAARGLAAGEVVEELQQLRDLLIRGLSDTIASLSARQSMAAILRLNRILDGGLAHAVVGYTDALVETLLNRRGVPIVTAEPAEDEVLQRLEALEEELAHLRNNAR